MRRFTAFGFAMIVAASAAQARAVEVPGASTSGDEQTLRAIIANLEADLPDRHESPGLDWENAFGIRYTDLKTRDMFYGAVVKPQMRSAQDQTLETKLRFVRPDVAVADSYWRVAGQIYAGDTKPGPDRWGRTTRVFTKTNGRWTEVLERVADLRMHYYKHFAAMPPPTPVPQAVLARYVGRYRPVAAADSGKPDAMVSLVGGRLILTRSGKALYLVPVTATEYFGFFAPDDFAEYLKVRFSNNGDLTTSEAWDEPPHTFRRVGG